jgi:hypothetical protein
MQKVCVINGRVKRWGPEAHPHDILLAVPGGVDLSRLLPGPQPWADCQPVWPEGLHTSVLQKRKIPLKAKHGRACCMLTKMVKTAPCFVIERGLGALVCHNVLVNVSESRLRCSAADGILTRKQTKFNREAVPMSMEGLLVEERC